MPHDNTIPEAETRTRVCPHHAGGSRTCLGSACMGWRWADPATETREAEQYAPSPYDRRTTVLQPEGEGWTLDAGKKRWERPWPDRAGYCGLAGQP